MKKYMLVVTLLLFAALLGEELILHRGVLYLPHEGEVACFAKAEGERLYLDCGEGFEEFSLRGVNLGLGKPGYYATDYAITKEEYLRWFRQIRELGANVIRIYTLAGKAFYDAFYEYNCGNDDPLYLLHGVWVDDYLINSGLCAWDEEFYEPFLHDCKVVVDVIHGRRRCALNGSVLQTVYDRDISPWVYGYILGVEWEGTLVSYTDDSFPQREQWEGTYFTTENGSNFEIFLAGIADEVVRYETRKYGTQRPIAFSNWPTTDPLEHGETIEEYFKKSGSVDVEHIRCTEAFAAGQFASYHVYPYYPDYDSFLPEHEENTYLQYLRELNEHHTMPVVIAEFGVPTSRGMAAYEEGLGRNQGGMSETEQGEALVSMYEDICAAGSAGAIVFSWQDEWFKRTWNTMMGTDLSETAYWGDVQTNEQYFALLSFDPGAEESVCCVDGDRSEWEQTDLVAEQEGCRLSMKYDEKFLYFLIEREGWTLGEETLYLPLDITPKSGTRYAENFDLTMSEESDFIVELAGEENSRVWVQERYHLLRALYGGLTASENPFSRQYPAVDGTTFFHIEMLLQKNLYYRHAASGEDEALPFSEYDSLDPQQYSIMETYETGLLTYGNADPSSPQFDSLADFCAAEGFVELRLPWGLLNFASPVSMTVHDDYYEWYGVELLEISSLCAGVGDGSAEVQMEPFALKRLGKTPQYHERLKASYAILQAAWKKEE